MLPDRVALWNLYIVGLIRNINAILAGVYGGNLSIPASNRSRGERSDEVLLRLIQQESIETVRKCLLQAESRIEKQGNAKLHDLAIGFTMLSTAQSIRHQTADRAAAIVSSSMLLGRVVPRLRTAYRLLDSQFPDKTIGELNETELKSALGDDYGNIRESVDEAIANERRAKHLRKLSDDLRSPRVMLGLFALIVDAGLDDRSFDEFLLGNNED